MKKIKLKCGREVLVDNSDYLVVRGYNWRYQENGGFAGTDVKKNGKYRTVLMHRMIIDTPRGMDTRHKNGNGLDNRRVNLKVVTRTQSKFKTLLYKNNKSGQRGVSWCKRSQLWRAYIGGKPKIGLGYFRNKKVAIQVRLLAEKKYIK